jgi:type I restriction enzyme S subunit
VVCRPRRAKFLGLAAAQLADQTFIDYCDASSTGTKMPRVSWEDMQRYPMSLPPESIVGAFNELVAPLLQMIVANAHESRTLAEVRDTLLPKLISGEIRVAEAERAMGVAV